MCDEAEIKIIASAAAEEAVAKTFQSLGVNINDAAAIRTFQANMGFMYNFRKLSGKVGAVVVLTLVTLITGGFVKLVWDAVTKKAGG